MVDNKKVFSTVITIAFYTVLIVSLILVQQKIKKIEASQEATFCLEWEGGITRDELLWRCYNFKTQTPICDWTISQDQTLFIKDYINNSNIINQAACITYAKTMTVVPELKEITINIQKNEPFELKQ